MTGVGLGSDSVKRESLVLINLACVLLSRVQLALEVCSILLVVPICLSMTTVVVICLSMTTVVAICLSMTKRAGTRGSFNITRRSDLIAYDNYRCNLLEYDKMRWH